MQKNNNFKTKKWNLIHAAQKELRAYQGQNRKIVVDIIGLTHRDVGQILFGNYLGQTRMFIRYILAMTMALCPMPDFKNWVFRRMGMRIGRNVYIAPLVYMDITRPDLIYIGDNVMIGMGAAIATHERNMELLALGRVTIGNGVTIGAHSLIRCGVSIGDGAVVDACSCVVRDIKSRSMQT